VLRDPLCYKLIWIAIADAANPATTGSHVHPAVSLPAAKAFVKRQFLWGKLSWALHANTLQRKIIVTSVAAIPDRL
jgi:hypothetical protein